MPIKSTFPSMVVGVLLGTFLSSILWYLLSGASISHDETEGESQESSEPLYWVAPMDDSYRRDKPGKSPMGMDLVPVYAETKGSSDMAHGGAGVVMISPQVQQNMGVKTEKVRVGALSPRIKVAGAVTYDEDEIMHIHPRVEGWIETLHIKSQGEEVKAGQPLYTLYSPELVNAQEEYLLALKRNDKRLIDGAEQRLNALALNERLIDDLKKNKRISQTVTFNAPQSGVVEAMAIREGFFVQPGTTIMSIAKIERVWVQAEVPSTYAGMIGIGDHTEISIESLPQQVFQGDVDYIYPSLSMPTRTLKVRIALANPNEQLKPNMFATVNILPKQQRQVLLVPKSAVIRTASRTLVVVSDGTGHFKSVEVTVGAQDTEYFEVTKGLLPDDDVVVSAQFLIDAESSKDSDFTRMRAPDNQATTTGKIEEISVGEDNSAVFTIARGPIEKWGRGPATMSFALSPHIDATQFNIGMQVRFTFVTGESFTIVDMQPIDEEVMDSHQHHMGMNHD